MSEIKDTVALSSQWMAAVRAIENKRPDGLFSDPIAAQLAGQEMIEKIAPSVQEYEDKGAPIVVVRTRFFDDFLMSVADSIRQVVILGAGMDTRAFRLSWWPNTHLYELEQPDVLKFKASRLGDAQAKCHRYSIEADLREPWSDLLLAKGYQPTLPTVWLLEGLLYYLTEKKVSELLTTITELSCPGSWLGADLINTEFLGSTDTLSQHWKFGCDEPEDFFSNYGWQADVIQPGEEGANFGRYTAKVYPRDVMGIQRGFFVKANYI